MVCLAVVSAHAEVSTNNCAGADTAADLFTESVVALADKRSDVG